MFDFRNRPLVIGHRGARGLYPENTLEGFSRATALGVEAIEFDVAVSADDVVVVTHDLRLNPDIVRGPEGRWLDPTDSSHSRSDFRPAAWIRYRQVATGQRLC